MITYRATFESEHGHITIRKAIAVPESLGELCHLFFRTNYTLSESKNDSWFPTFDKEVSTTYTPEAKQRIAARTVYKFEVHPVKINGKPYK